MTVIGRRQYWADQIAAQKTSGLNITDWCNKHSLNRRQFHYWINNLEKLGLSVRNKDAIVSTLSSGWVKVCMEQRHQREPEESPLVLRVGAVAIEIKPGFNTTLLADTLRVLQTLC